MERRELGLWIRLDITMINCTVGLGLGLYEYGLELKFTFFITVNAQRKIY